jgi:hypothetical protein
MYIYIYTYVFVCVLKNVSIIDLYHSVYIHVWVCI